MLEKRRKLGRDFAYLACARPYTKGACAKEDLLGITSCKAHSSPMKRSNTTILIVQMMKQGLEKLSNLPKDTQLESARGGIQNHICLVAKDHTLNPYAFFSDHEVNMKQ